MKGGRDKERWIRKKRQTGTDTGREKGGNEVVVVQTTSTDIIFTFHCISSNPACNRNSCLFLHNISDADWLWLKSDSKCFT